MPSYFPNAAPVLAFRPRAERLDLSFPVEFRAPDGQTAGSCQNLSLSGMMARFRRPLELWTSGDLWFNSGVLILELRVRVVRVNDRDAGLAFRFRDEREREAVKSVVTFAAEKTGLVGRPF